MKKAVEILTMFLTLLIAGDFEKAFGHTQKTWAEKKTFENLKKLFRDKRLKKFTILSSTNVSNAKAEVLVALDFGKTKHQAVVNVICESWPRKTDAYGDWGVNPISVLKAITEEEPVDEEFEALKLKAIELKVDFKEGIKKAEIQKLIDAKETEIKEEAEKQAKKLEALKGSAAGLGIDFTADATEDDLKALLSDYSEKMVNALNRANEMELTVPDKANLADVNKLIDAKETEIKEEARYTEVVERAKVLEIEVEGKTTDDIIALIKAKEAK